MNSGQTAGNSWGGGKTIGKEIVYEEIAAKTIGVRNSGGEQQEEPEKKKKSFFEKIKDLFK